MTVDQVDELLAAIHLHQRRLWDVTFHLDWAGDADAVCIRVTDGMISARRCAVACDDNDVALVSADLQRQQYFQREVALLDIWGMVRISGRIEALMCASGFFES